MPISRIFGVPDLAGSFLGLLQPFCAFCTFYHILLISLSRAYRLFLRYACFIGSFAIHFIPVSIYVLAL